MQGKTAIITGGGSGFGRETAIKLAQKGVNISVVDLSKENGEETVNLCNKLGSDAIFIQADVSKVEDVKKYVAETVEHFGKIDHFLTMQEFLVLELELWNVPKKNSMQLLM